MTFPARAHGQGVLGGDHEAVAVGAEEAAEDLLGLAFVVLVGGVDEVAARQVHGRSPGEVRGEAGGAQLHRRPAAVRHLEEAACEGLVVCHVILLHDADACRMMAGRRASMGNVP
jgi:hypothetical protein